MPINSPRDEPPEKGDDLIVVINEKQIRNTWKDGTVLCK